VKILKKNIFYSGYDIIAIFLYPSNILFVITYPVNHLRYISSSREAKLIASIKYYNKVIFKNIELKKNKINRAFTSS